MKKIVIPIVAIFSIIGVIFMIFFTPFGSNNLLKPILNKQIEKRIKKPKIEIINVESRLNKIKIDALIQDSITLNLLGTISYLSKSFDLLYFLKAKELTYENTRYKLNLDIKGRAKGNIKKFDVNGAGKAFGSNLNYKFIVENKLIKYIVAKIYNAKIAQILLLAKQPPVVNGLLDLDINMPSLDINNPIGEGYLKIYKGYFNRKLIYKKYKILLPKKEQLNANIAAKVQNKKILAVGDINTTTAKIHIKKLVSTLDFNIAKGYFDIKIPNLSRLNSITKHKLRGALNLDAITYLNRKKKSIQALVTTKSFGGETKIKYLNKKIKLSLNKVELPLIEKKLSLPLFVTKGNISGKALVKNLKSYESDFELKSKFILNPKLLKIDLPSYKYTLYTKGSFKDLAISSTKTTLSSNYLKLLASNLKYSLISKRFKSDFNVEILDLKKLQPLTKTTLRGKLNLKGNIEAKGSKIALNATTKSFDGVLKTLYKNDNLKVDFKNISISKVLYTLNQPAIVKKGFATGNLYLSSLKKLRGKGAIKANALVDNQILHKVYKINLGKNITLYIKAPNIIIKNNKIQGDILIKTKGAIFNFYDLTYDISSKSLKTNYGLDIKDLSILNALTKQKLTGELKVVGEISRHGKYIFLSGNSSKFDGTINFLLKGNNFTLNGAGISIIKLLKMLNKPQNFDGVAKIDLKYNLKLKKGNFNIIIDNGKFLNSKLVENIKRYANFDLSKELFNKVLIDGEIDRNIIIFNLATKSNRVTINIYKGKIDIKNNTIYAKVRVHLNGNDYNFIVKGPLNNPSYKISYSGVIKKKVQKRLKKELKKLGIDKEIKKIIPKEIQEIDKIISPETKKSAKELIRGLFK